VTINAYNFFEKYEGKKQLGEPKCKWKDNNIKDINETGCEGEDSCLLGCSAVYSDYTALQPKRQINFYSPP
jgi:hypothetical protein